MEAKEIKKAIKEHGRGKNVSYDDKYFTHNMPEFMCIAEISFSAGEKQGIQKGRSEVVKWIKENNASSDEMNWITVLKLSEEGEGWQNQKKDWGL